MIFESPNETLCLPQENKRTREQEIVTYISTGHTNREIADALCISIKTVDNHRTKAMKKLGLNKAAELVKFAFNEGLVV
ncbi:response regulator transcription factor [Pseudoalteromonas luteoviolacea]|uniref:response regulator transcription factor n=1 Tax=Pseudoalteromonas luteoviolacea TaxID=43657 RepID=UPI003D7E3AA9